MSNINPLKRKKIKLILATVIPVVLLTIIVVGLIVGLTMKSMSDSKKPFTKEEIQSFFDSNYFTYSDEKLIFSIKNRNNPFGDILNSNNKHQIEFSLVTDKDTIVKNISIKDLLNNENNDEVSLKIAKIVNKKTVYFTYKYKINLVDHLVLYEYDEVTDRDMVYDLIPTREIKDTKPSFIFDYLNEKSKNTSINYVGTGYDKYRTTELFEDATRLKRVSSLKNIRKCYFSKIREDEASSETKLIKVYYQNYLNDEKNYEFDEEYQYFYCRQGDNLNFLIKELNNQVDIYRNEKYNYFDTIKWYIYYQPGNKIIRDENIVFDKFLSKQSNYIYNLSQKTYTYDNSGYHKDEKNNFTIYFYKIYIVPEARLKKLDILYEVSPDKYELETKAVASDVYLKNYEEGTNTFIIPDNHYHYSYISRTDKEYSINTSLNNIIPDKEDIHLTINDETTRFTKNTYIILKPKIDFYKKIVVTTPHPRYCADYINDNLDFNPPQEIIVAKLKAYLPIKYYLKNWFNGLNELPSESGFTKEHFSNNNFCSILPDNSLSKINDNITVKEYFESDAKIKDATLGYVYLEPDNPNLIAYKVNILKDGKTSLKYLILDENKTYNLEQLGFITKDYYFNNQEFTTSKNYPSNEITFEYIIKNIYIQMKYITVKDKVFKELPLLNYENFNSRDDYKVNSKVSLEPLSKDADTFVRIPIEYDFKGIENLYFKNDFSSESQIKNDFVIDRTLINKLENKDLSKDTIVIYLFFKAEPLVGQLKVKVMVEQRNFIIPDAYELEDEFYMTTREASAYAIDFDYNSIDYIQIRDKMREKNFVEKTPHPSLSYYYNRENLEPEVSVYFTRERIIIDFYYQDKIVYNHELKHDVSFEDISYDLLSVLKLKTNNYELSLISKVFENEWIKKELTIEELLKHRFQKAPNRYKITILEP